jgi:hypothetical protein
LNCFLVGKERCRVAVEASVIAAGYDGPDSDVLYIKGAEAFARMRTELRDIKQQQQQLALPPPETSRPLLALPPPAVSVTATGEPVAPANGNAASMASSEPQLAREQEKLSDQDQGEEQERHCQARLQTGPRAGQVCNRIRPCRYHDKQQQQLQRAGVKLQSMCIIS